MSTSPAEFNAKVIEEFHANEGRVGGMFDEHAAAVAAPHRRESGKSRINPLAYQSDDGRYVVFASKGGAPANPDWYHNLKAQPHVKIEVGTDTLDVVASEASSEERERLYRSAGRADAAVRRVRGEDRARHPGDGPLRPPRQAERRKRSRPRGSRP